MRAWRARVSWARVCLCMWWNGKEARKGSWNRIGQSRLAVVKRPGLNQFSETMHALLIFGVLGSNKSTQLYL